MRERRRAWQGGRQQRHARGLQQQVELRPLQRKFRFKKMGSVEIIVPRTSAADTLGAGNYVHCIAAHRIGHDASAGALSQPFSCKKEARST